MKINKEGYWIIIITGLLCLSIWALVYFLIDTHIAIMWFMAAFLLVFWFFVAAFFREPRRVQIHDDELLFSPCDGRVVVTEVVTDDEYIKEEMMQISIFMSVTNVHMNWMPVRGVVEYFKHHHGRFLVYMKPGNEVEQNSVMGFIKFGSRVDILIPKDSELYVEIGDPVIGSQTPIARLKRRD